MTYPGGKSGAGVYQSLINLMPPHDVYIEPFLGGGAIMRLKRPARVNIGVDLDPDALKMAMESRDYLVGSPDQASGAASGTASSGAAARDLASSQAAGSAEAPRRRKSSASAMEASRSHIDESGDRSSRFSAMGPGQAPFKFLHGDGIQFLEVYPFSGGELVYCDPPYVRSSRSGARDLYKHEMTDLEHRRLLRVIRTLPCMVMISGYPSKLYNEELPPEWNKAYYQAVNRAGRSVTETCWFNFPKPTELHDWRYLGRNFRERERINRRRKRWIARLERMPVLERQALLAALQRSG